MARRNKNRRLNPSKNPAVWLGVAAAILYSSWPLGYILNPSVAHTAFASQLEASSQPYNWLFISLDILSGATLLIAGLTQWTRTKSAALRMSIIAYMVFAALVIVAAVVPFDCDSLTGSCVDVAHSPLIIIHGLASIVSGVALISSLILILGVLVDRRLQQWFKLLPLIIFALWGIVGLAALDRYHHSDENLVLYAFITICSISLVTPVYIIEVLTPRRKKSRI